MTDRELMQQALDALEYVIQSVGGNAPESFDVWFQKTQVPAEALRARLAQPEPEELGEVIPADEEQLKRIAKLIEPEPVAWITDGGKGELWWHQSVKFDDDGNLIGENPDDIPLYTAPPQREWQGLTEAERIDIIDEEITAQSTEHFALAQAIEAKLKEKNNG